MGGAPRLLAKLLKWPLFVWAVLTLYWSVVAVSLTGHLKWLKLRGKRNDIFAWADGMRWLFRLRILKIGDQPLYRGKCVYLFNHRSWADFIVDQWVTEGRSLFMGRWAVAAVFPTFLMSMLATRSVILFKRGSIADKDRFNKWIDRQLEESPQHALSVYPEGHRSTHGESLPLKRGMLHYAFRRRLPVQIVIGANKEAILSEKHHTARLNQVAAVGFSEVIHAEQYDSFDAFMAKVQQTWDAQWDAVFSADWEGLHEFPAARIDNEYPLFLSLRMLGAVLLNWAAFVFVWYHSLRLWRWALSLLGPAQPAALVLLALWVAASVAAYSQPVDALHVHGRRRSRPDMLAARGERDMSYGALDEATARPPPSKED